MGAATILLFAGSPNAFHWNRPTTGAFRSVLQAFLQNRPLERAFNRHVAQHGYSKVELRTRFAYFSHHLTQYADPPPFGHLEREFGKRPNPELLTDPQTETLARNFRDPAC
jgi:hypothetical protein